MSSNSKLTPLQKKDRKEMLAALPRTASMSSDPISGLTILAVPDSTVTRFYSSVMGDDEQKFRRKVGEYHALMRWDDAPASFILPGFWTAAMIGDLVSEF